MAKESYALYSHRLHMQFDGWYADNLVAVIYIIQFDRKFIETRLKFIA